MMLGMFFSVKITHPVHHAGVMSLGVLNSVSSKVHANFSTILCIVIEQYGGLS
jgi:hypothetical protein